MGPRYLPVARSHRTRGRADFDEAWFDRLASRLRYVDGDYTDPDTFDRLRQALGDRRRPLHYLAIPPSLYETVIGQLDRIGCAEGSVVEKPFGRPGLLGT